MACVARSFVAEGAHIITDSIQPVTGSAGVSSASPAGAWQKANEKLHRSRFFRASRSLRARAPALPVKCSLPFLKLNQYAGASSTETRRTQRLHKETEIGPVPSHFTISSCLRTCKAVCKNSNTNTNHIVHSVIRAHLHLDCVY